MSHRRLIPVLLTSGALLLAACGSDATASPTVSTKAPAAPATTAAKQAGSHDMTNMHDKKPVDDRGFSKLENGMEHGYSFPQAISKADRVILGEQLVLARKTALRYPTVKDAMAAGLHRAGPFSPGLGAHYIDYSSAGGNDGSPMTNKDIEHPLAWIYDGNLPDSKIVGLFYTTSSATPEGFAGPNDVWHEHHDICLVQNGGEFDTPLGADHSATEAECNVVKGKLLKQTSKLLHVWVVPGYESPEGVFSHLSSTVTCDDGSYNMIPDVTKVGTKKTLCIDGTEG